MGWSAEELLGTASESHPPLGLPVLVEAMWWQAHGDWERAHEIAQEIDSRDAAWVHAYLHRVEGDAGNALYWYRQAARPMSKAALTEEWAGMVEALLRA